MKIRQILLALVLVVVLGLNTTTAFASTVYYPNSGYTSGNCTNVTRSSICTYNRLPSGTYTINYTTESSCNLDLRFYTDQNCNGSFTKATLYNNPNGSSTTVVLPSTNKYYVVVATSNGSASTFTYAYTLVKN